MVVGVVVGLVVGVVVGVVVGMVAGLVVGFVVEGLVVCGVVLIIVVVENSPTSPKSVQVRPQPLEQHFCFPGHLLSPVQFISQGPSPATNGQVPVLTTKINKSRLINLTAFLTPFSRFTTSYNM